MGQSTDTRSTRAQFPARDTRAGVPLARVPEWRDELPTFEIDGERFYLPWGDVPMDVDQIVYHWARSHGLLDGTESSDRRGPVGDRPPPPAHDLTAGGDRAGDRGWPPR